jgi:putative ABC transport system permease protein
MRTVWPRLRAAWVALTGTGAVASAAFGVLVFAAVLASLAIPRESVGLSNEALQRVIAASPRSDQTVTATAVMVSTLTQEPIQVSATDIAAASASLRSRLSAAGVPAASSPPPWSSLTTDDIQVTGTARGAGYGTPRFDMTYRTAMARYSRIVAGRFPANGLVTGSQSVVQAVVTTSTAARFGLRVGTRLNAGSLPLVITGIVQPVLPASFFWKANPAAAAPVLTTASPGSSYWTGVLFTGPGALPLIESALDPTMNATFWYPAGLGQLTAGQAGVMEAGLTGLASSGVTVNTVEGPVLATITTPIPSIVSPFITEENAVAPVLELLYVSLAVIGAVVVLLGAGLVARRRAIEFTLMRARGAALRQLAWLVLRSSVIIAAAAGAAAAITAVGLTSGDDEAMGWWLAGLTLAVTVAGPVLISVLPQRVAAPAGGQTRRGRGGRRPALRRIVVEAALAAMAIGGLVVLRDQGLAPGNSGLYPSAAPVLVAIPVAIVVLWCYPPLVRELARFAGLSRGVVAFVGLARATRTAPGAVLPSFALVLVLAMVAFPDMISGSVTRSQVAASWQQVGADAIISAPSGAVISPALRRQIASVPGVVSTATAVVEAGSLPNGNELSAVFVDPAQYAAVTDQAPGSRFPVAALSGPTAAGFPAVATAAASLSGSAPIGLSLGSATITIRLAGQIADVPGVSQGAVLLPASALGSSPPEPNLELIGGPGLDGARLNAIVHRALPDGSVTLRAAVLSALTTAPVLQAARMALTPGLVAAAGFGALVLVLSLLLAAQTREMTMAGLATMGLRRWQAQLLLATETLPPIVAAAIGGVACAWLLVPLIGPSLNLTAFSGTGSAIAVTPAVLPLAESAAGLVLAALFFLTAQIFITYHRGSARALRIAD